MKHDELLTLGHKIRLERMKRNISQEEFAELAGLSRRSISCIECGVSDPRYTTLLQIARTFNMNMAELFSFKL
ncbi:MAG: helix-turn-helix domain-containing protein [Heliobacteriaceae bacterium]|jgi:putative transcriptional regulator|nr:helix-turn-helix domain-containing protein [Heliobacteriaceae bacterium]